MVSLSWSATPDDSADYLKRLAQLLVFFLLIWEFAVTYDDQLWIFRSFLLGMAVPALMALLGISVSMALDIESGERFSGGGQDLNYLAYMLNVAILVAIYLAGSSRPLDRFLRWWYWGFAAWWALQPNGVAGRATQLVGYGNLRGIDARDVIRQYLSKRIAKIALWARPVRGRLPRSRQSW